MGAFYQSKLNSFKVYIVAVIVFLALPLSGCAVIDNATQFASDKTAKNTDMIDDFIHGEDVDVKFDTPSASDVMNGDYDQSGSSSSEGYGYYDAKSGQYVSKTQFDVNNFVDNLKTFWIPLCLITFFIGFMIRRLNHSSATLRKIGFFFEIIFPVLLTLIVYIACALADSSMVDFFDNLF